MNFQEFLTVTQLVQDLENLRRDMLYNLQFCVDNIAIRPLQEIIDVHMKQNATQYQLRLTRIDTLYSVPTRAAAIRSAFAGLGVDVNEAPASAAELQTAVSLIIDTPMSTPADVIAVADAILLPAGAAHVAAHESLWG